MSLTKVAVWACAVHRPAPTTRAQRFTSAGGANEWETFTFAETDIPRSHTGFTIVAVSGPTFANVPDYPALRVVDFQVVGERVDNGPGYFNVRPHEGMKRGNLSNPTVGVTRLGSAFSDRLRSSRA